MYATPRARVCTNCGITFYTQQQRRCCSDECARQRQANSRAVWTPEMRERHRQAELKRMGMVRRTHMCEHCGEQFPHRRRAAKDANRFCSRKCASAARRVGHNASHHERKGWPCHKWSLAVRERDGHTCQQCGATINLHAHHILSWSDFPAFRFDVDNGVTLCAGCHISVHRDNPLSSLAS